MLTFDAQAQATLLGIGRNRGGRLAFHDGLEVACAVARRPLEVPIRLAFGSMTLTVGLVALAGFYGLGLPLGAAILLGAVLAPTDPCLPPTCSSKTRTIRDRLHALACPGEAGLNDGTAFPFVMLGLGLLGLHDLGEERGGGGPWT